VARKRRALLPKQLRAGGVRNAVRLLYPKLARSLPWVTGLPHCTIWHRVMGYYLGAAQASVAPFLGKPQALAANRAQGQGIDYFALKSIAGPLPRLTCPHGGPDDADATTGGLANPAHRFFNQLAARLVCGKMLASSFGARGRKAKNLGWCHRMRHGQQFRCK
jgi:hypothetical protein